jgi:hypothetical protein
MSDFSFAAYWRANSAPMPVEAPVTSTNPIVDVVF